MSHRVGRVNEILKSARGAGQGFAALRGMLRETICASRPLAAVWYARIALPENEEWISRVLHGSPNETAIRDLQEHWNSVQNSRWSGFHEHTPRFLRVDGVFGPATRAAVDVLLERIREAQRQLAVIEDALGERSGANRMRPLYDNFLPVLFSTGRFDLGLCWGGTTFRGSVQGWEEVLAAFDKLRDVNSTEQWNTDEFWRLCDLATIDYRAKSPRSRATRRWQVGFQLDGAIDGGPDELRQGAPVVICAYCKHVLCARQQGVSKDFTRQTNPHTLSCALWFLAFDEPVHMLRDRVIRERELLRKHYDEGGMPSELNRFDSEASVRERRVET